MFPLNHVLTNRELGGPSGDLRVHVESPDRVMGRIWRLGDRLSTAPVTYVFIILILIVLSYYTINVFSKPHPPLHLGPDPAMSSVEWKELFDIYLDASDLSSAADKRKIAAL